MTLAFPFNDVVYISDNLDGGVRASGVVIGPHTILTAAHVLWDSAPQSQATAIKLFPGYDGSGDPSSITGSFVTGAEHFIKINDNDGARDSMLPADSQQDFAVIDVSTKFSSWMSVQADFGGGTVNISGYPAQPNGVRPDVFTQQNYSNVSVTTDPTANVLDYTNFTPHGGNSGGPLWIDKGTAGSPVPYVVGLVSTSGWAMRLTDADLATIDAWITPITGLTGNDTITVGPGGASITATAGNDQISIPAPDLGPSSFIGLSGNHSVAAAGGSNTLVGGSGSNLFSVTGGFATIFAGSGQTTIDIAGSAKILAGPGGTDIWVNGGTNTLTMQDNGGSVIISGFDPSHLLLQVPHHLNGHDFASVSQIAVTQTPSGNTVLHLGPIGSGEQLINLTGTSSFDPTSILLV